jgi:hypothetical protein
VNVHRLRIHNVSAEDVTARLDLDHGKLKLTNVRADLFGGRHSGDWHADFTASPPMYAGAGTFTGVSLRQVADAMHGAGFAGTATATYQVSASGANAASFWQTAEGDLQFDINDGLLSRASSNGDDSPLLVSRWSGEIRLRAGKIEIGQNKIVSPSEFYELSGTASLAQSLDLQLHQVSGAKPVAGAPVYNITGTLAHPEVVVSAPPQTQAKLKRQ